MLLNNYDSSTDNLKANLRHLLERLDAYMKFYKRSYTILYPVFFVLGLLFGALESGFDRFIHKFENPLYTASFIILSIIFMVGVYTITNWYLKKLYGNHIEKLRTILDDLKD
jgi:fumarate reductase subunit C